MVQPQVVSQPRSCYDLELHAVRNSILWTVAAALHAAPGAHTSCSSLALWQISQEIQQDLHTSLKKRHNAQCNSLGISESVLC